MITATSDVIAIIPVRGGSKGVPGKNLMPVAGRPLLAWTIAAVASASAPIRCVVTTDDDALAALAAELGAEVVRRPASLATDTAPTEPALLHALDALGVPSSAAPSPVVLFLQVTSPVRLPGTIDAAVAQFHASGADAIVGVVAEHPFLWRGPTTAPTALYDPDARPRRQDLRDDQLVYRETGSLYLTSASALRASGNRISGRVELFVMADTEGIDIDTAADVENAERVLKELR